MFVDSRRAVRVAALMATVGLAGCGLGGDGPHQGLMTGPTRGSAVVQAHLATLYAHLHDLASGTEAHTLLPDLTLVYTDEGHGNARIPKPILPFRYWYSAEADVTVSICAKDYTVFICPGRVDTLVDSMNWNSCTVSASYRDLETPIGGAP